MRKSDDFVRSPARRDASAPRGAFRPDRDRPIEGNDVRDELEEIKNAAARAASLTQQLLAFSRQQVVRPVQLDLNEIVAEIERMLQRLIGEDVALVVKLDPAVARS